MRNLDKNIALRKLYASNQSCRMHQFKNTFNDFADFSFKCDPYILKTMWLSGVSVTLLWFVLFMGLFIFLWSIFVHCCTSFTAFHKVFMNHFKTYERKSAVGTTPLVKDAKCVWLPTYNNCLYKSIPWCAFAPADRWLVISPLCVF